MMEGHKVTAVATRFCGMLLFNGQSCNVDGDAKFQNMDPVETWSDIQHVTK